MRTPVIITLLVIVVLASFGGASVRWLKYKNNPTEETSVEHFQVDPDKVRNPEPNLNYFGTINVTTKTTAGSYPKVDVVVIRDTISSKEGGYFGKPK